MIFKNLKETPKAERYYYEALEAFTMLYGEKPRKGGQCLQQPRRALLWQQWTWSVLRRVHQKAQAIREGPQPF